MKRKLRGKEGICMTWVGDEGGVVGFESGNMGVGLTFRAISMAK